MKLKRILSIFLSFILILAMTGCGYWQNQSNITELMRKKSELLSDAYIFALPLMMIDATFTKSTNTVKPTDKQAPVNQFIHANNLATSDDKDVVTPNVDTIYSQAFLDLENDAVIMELPKTDRFCTVEVIDAYTNCIEIIDTTKFENDSESFIFTSDGFSDTIPDGMTEIKSPTNLVWIIVRTVCHSSNDIINIKEIQNKMDLYTLSQYNSGTTEEKPDGIFDERNNFIPSEYVLNLSMEEYFDRANILLEKYPPSEADGEIVEKIKQINVGANLEFDSSIFGENAETLWQELVSGITDKVTESSMKFIDQNGCWLYMGEPIAEFGTEYEYRALISLVGLGANPVSVAVYPKTSKDSEGYILSGENNYVLHFDKDGLPNVEEHGFWSITIYNSEDNFLIDNEIDRYCINDRSDLKFNEDGSLDIYIQSDKPEENISNWLPAGEGDFKLVLRVYYPSDEVVNNSWTAPVINKV